MIMQKFFSYESFTVPSYSDEVNRSHLKDERSMNAITSLRSGKILPNIVLTKESKIEKKVGNPELSDKIPELGNTPESEEVNEKGKEHLIPFPNAFTRKKENIENSLLLNILKNTSITIPLTNAIRYIPLYGKFVKELCTPS